MKPAKKAAQGSVGNSATRSKRSKGFTDEERAAMKDRIRELNAGEEGGESSVLAKIAAMPEPDRAMGRRLHAIIMSSVPALSPRLWYGMPAYSKDGKVLCHFQPAHKFKTRYSTLGFSDKARLDDGSMWPNAYALKELTPAEEAKIRALVKKAAS